MTLSLQLDVRVAVTKVRAWTHSLLTRKCVVEIAPEIGVRSVLVVAAKPCQPLALPGHSASSDGRIRRLLP